MWFARHMTAGTTDTGCRILQPALSVRGLTPVLAVFVVMATETAFRLCGNGVVTMRCMTAVAAHGLVGGLRVHGQSGRTDHKRCQADRQPHAMVTFLQCLPFVFVTVGADRYLHVLRVLAAVTISAVGMALGVR